MIAAQATQNSLAAANPKRTMAPSSLPSDSDALQALFVRARKGERQAVDALCLAMRPRLFAAAMTILHDVDAADDVAQDALVKALTKWRLFLGTGSAAGWMHRIATNLAKNKRRDQQRRGTLLQQAAPSTLQARGALGQVPQDGEATTLAAQQQRSIQVAFSQLPARQRQVAELRLLGELSFAEIGSALEITEANARVTFSHARAALTRLLRDDDTPDGAPGSTQATAANSHTTGHGRSA